MIKFSKKVIQNLLILQLVLIINRVKRKKMTMKYASFWILLIIIMSIVVIFPGIVFKLSNIAGFEEASNMIFLLGFFFLFYVSFIILLCFGHISDTFSAYTMNYQQRC